MITRAGFQAQLLPFEHSELESSSTHVFIGIKPEDVYLTIGG